MSNIGLFSKLPFELRDQIWNECSYSPKSHLSRTCKRLNSDMQDYLYRDLSLSFDLDPHHDTEPSPSLVRVLDQDLEKVCALSLNSLQNKKRSRFWAFPFYEVKSFKFILWPPSPDRMGELIRLWKIVSSLLAGLRENLSTWPEVIFDVKESASRRWKTLDRLRRDLATDLSRNAPMSNLEDIYVALMPFSTLRLLPRPPEFSNPYCIPEKLHTWIFFHIGINTTDTNAGYGVPLCRNNWNIGSERERDKDFEIDSECEETLAEWNLKLERELDLLDDSSAASLRLERCANWSKLFEKEYGCWIWGRKGFCDGSCRNDWEPFGGAGVWGQANTEEVKQLLWDRYQNMRSLNPSKLPDNEIRCNREEHEVVTSRDGWDASLWWECYKDGLPPLACSSENYKAFSKIDVDGIKLRDERNELDMKKGGWRSWPDEDESLADSWCENGYGCPPDRC